MRENLKKLLTIILIIITLSSFDVVFLGNKIVKAVADSLETYSDNTNNVNVKFEAYFKEKDKKTHNVKKNISNQDTSLYLYIKVQDRGILDNAKVKIDDSNFKIKTNEITNSNIKNINLDSNEIELNSITHGNEIELEIPVEFKKVDSLKSEYFSKETNISMEGTYRNDEKEETIKGKIITRIDWSDDENITLSENIEKCVDLKDNQMLLEQNIISKIEQGELPRENESLKIAVPEISNEKPTNVKVIFNGSKIEDSNISYDNKNGELKINVIANKDENDNTIWSKNKTNVYKVIYLYGNVSKENVSKVKLKTEMNTKVFTKDVISNKAEDEIQVNLNGNLVSIQKNIIPGVYKGYLYANSQNRTEYKENNTVEISNIDNIQNLKIYTDNTYFKDGNNTKYDANNLIKYEETYLNKNKMMEIFGEDGYINVKNATGNTIQTIDKNTETDENGKITIKYEENTSNIVLETSKPVKEGMFTIQNQKYVNGETGYAKEQLKQFLKLNTNGKVETNLSTDETNIDMNLMDTKTEAKLEVNNSNISTLQKNENIEFRLTLKTSSPENDLFKNPTFEIKIPNVISNISVKSVNTVSSEMFNITEQKIVDNENGEKVIRISLQGEQTEYTNEINETAIVVNADIETNILTPSQKANIETTYTNENGNEKTYKLNTDLNIQSKSGMMIYNNISNYNNAKDSIYTIDDNVPMGALDLRSNSNVATVKSAIINNFGQDIENVTIVGRIPKNGQADGSVDSTLIKGIETNLNGVEILYSENINAKNGDDSWKEDPTNASIYMIKIDNMQAQQVAAIQYEIQVPEDIGYGKKLSEETNVKYTISGNTQTQKSRVQAKTEELINKNVMNLANSAETTENGLTVNISTVSAGSELKDGDSIYEGEHIVYTAQITNNTGNELKNVGVKATQTKGKIYGLYAEETYDPNVGEDSKKVQYRYKELDTSEKEFAKSETLANGESKTITYEIVVQEVEGENEQTYGNLVISANGLNNDINVATIKNNIKQAEVKATLENARWEGEKIYLEQSVQLNLTIENTSGKDLTNLKGTIKLPDGVYCKDPDALILSTDGDDDNEEEQGEDEIENNENDDANEDEKEDDSDEAEDGSIDIGEGSIIANRTYDDDKKIMSFELSELKAQEKVKLELYVYAEDFKGESKNFNFLYSMQSENTYNSNVVNLDVINTIRDVVAEQTANIDSGKTLKDGDKFELKLTVSNNDKEDLWVTINEELDGGLNLKSAKIKYLGTENEVVVSGNDEEEDNEEYEEDITTEEKESEEDSNENGQEEMKEYSNENESEENENEDKEGFSASIEQIKGQQEIKANSKIEIIMQIEVEEANVEGSEDQEENQVVVLNSLATITYGKKSEYEEYTTDWNHTFTVNKEFNVMTEIDDEKEQVSITQTANPEDKSMLQDKQKTEYIFEIRNNKNFDIETTLIDYIPKGIVVEKITLDGKQIGNTNKIKVKNYEMEPGQISNLKIEGYFDKKKAVNDPIVNSLTAETDGESIISNSITYKTDKSKVNPNNPTKPDNPNNPSNPTNPGDSNNGNNAGNGQYSISGIAWVDSNKDGKRDDSEKVLAGVGVKVIDAEKGTYVSDINVKTSDNGEYKVNVDSGNYILVFSYDTSRYNLTQYKASGVSNDKNSDVISKDITIDGNIETVGATDNLQIDSSNLINIDIGLTESATFDLELDKYINEITVQTNKNTTKYGYNKQNLVKVEIGAKELNNSTVIMRYSIQVTNTGDVAGYVQNIIDYMPSDLKFKSELNSDWYESNGALYNTSLSNTAIQPGESKNVNLVLVKNINETNTGTVVNTAEIGKASNALELDDVDSTPNNKKADEDDYGKAEVIISVKTGSVVMYIFTIFLSLAIIALGTYVINKKLTKYDIEF